MTDLHTALRRLNDAAHEALRAAKEDYAPSGRIVLLQVIAMSTDRMVDETAPNVEQKP